MSEGLRAQKKHETRKTISDVATRLFIRDGFEDVTIAEIATEARVAKMTVTNHFPRKEDLVFDIRADFTSWPSSLIHDSVFHDTRELYFEALDAQHALAGFSGRGFARMIKQSPVLTNALHELHREREANLSGLLTARHPGDGLRPVLAAAHLTTLLRVLFDDVFDRTIADQPKEAIVDAVWPVAEQAFDQLEPAFGGY
ncbi:TetR/AcrR family transcriptional regulator [Amycolatopsis balhimycina DSM 5908]|uniref:TetR/AcrR family transcriptional regulator n=1 Tax=Amycolatopsis balhimycina DSM 5908 TaxID=1081091 RepID=A0A428W6N2_AMYBA|nr:TetR/AcrR family transcriptional regulator [Amycolatopsis balhimycina]RSM38693.1 TetR/AcrR family transcriptional regulator [Amycolatopsis balhimycina DSM 5908]